MTISLQDLTSRLRNIHTGSLKTDAIRIIQFSDKLYYC